MAHFAKIEEGLVTQVIVVDNSDITDGNGDEQESLGIDFINNTLGISGTWKQTSYNNNLRANYAGVGFTYDSTNDVFYPPSPGEGYSLNTSTWLWEKD